MSKQTPFWAKYVPEDKDDHTCRHVGRKTRLFREF